MSSTRADFALLLASPDPVEADLAKDLLSSAGIPCMLHGQDRDLAEFGAAGHACIARPDLLVPKSALTRARALLGEAWNGGSLTDALAVDLPSLEEDADPSRFSSLVWIVFAGFLALAFLVSYSRLFGARAL